MKLIDIYNYEGQGYDPSLISDGWQAAYLNYSPTETYDKINKLDVHFQTDEAFVLLEGTAVLIAANIDGDDIQYDMINMKHGIIYNIPKNTWHNVAVLEGAKICIIEKALTHEGDYEFHYLSEQQRAELINEIKKHLE